MSETAGEGDRVELADGCYFARTGDETMLWHVHAPDGCTGFADEEMRSFVSATRSRLPVEVDFGIGQTMSRADVADGVPRIAFVKLVHGMPIGPGEPFAEAPADHEAAFAAPDVVLRFHGPEGVHAFMGQLLDMVRMVQHASGITDEEVLSDLASRDTCGSADAAYVEAELSMIERQVEITCDLDRKETEAKRSDPLPTTVELSLSHITDAVKRIRARLPLSIL